MFTVKKGRRVQTLQNEVQVAAFVANGWKLVAEKTRPAGQQEEPPDENMSPDEEDLDDNGQPDE